MGYKFQDELRGRAERFMRAAKRAGMDASIVEDSFRDYTVKVSISAGGEEFGNANLYYSPKANAFSMKTHELKDKSIAAGLEDCWHEESAADEAAADSGFQIYVDGSYINGSTGYGLVVLKGGRVVEELCGQVADAEVGGTHQVAGELRAVEEGLKWCEKNGVKEVSIFYDYLGIEKWATGAWKAKQPLTQRYAKLARESGVRVRWRKVNSHTGDRWNDRADKLAKKGALSVASVAGDTEGVSALLEKKDRFIEFLMVNGIDAAFDRVYNDQFARVMVLEDEKGVGIFDLYHTKRKPFSPYLHKFKDDELKSEIEGLWKEFI
ncbi:MAG TPA: RNase H family protein, partial [Blastocatellia bacterium]|nr:RNase H family protein [Blastocatellia bacterium]